MTKLCRRCRTAKPAADFKKNPRVSDGLSSWCRSCHNLANRESRRRKKLERSRARAEESERFAEELRRRALRSNEAA